MCLVGHVDALERLGERADLVRLDENRIGDVPGYRFAQDLRVGHEHVIAYELDGLAESLRELRPAVPVGLAHPVLDADDRVARGEIGQIVGELRGGEAALLPGELVAAVAEEFRARHIETQIHIVPGTETGALDGLEDERERRLVGIEARRESALIAYG